MLGSIRRRLALTSLVVAVTVSPCFANPDGTQWINTPAYYEPPIVRDSFELEPLGGAPANWLVEGAAVLTEKANHTKDGLQSVALTAIPGEMVSMTYHFSSGIQGASVAILTLPIGTPAKLRVTSVANTFTEVGLYDFTDGSHWADAGLGMGLEELLPPEFFGNWIVFDRSGPLFDPLLGYLVGPDVDHKPNRTDWSHPPTNADPTEETLYSAMIISLENLSESNLTVFVDDLRGFDRPILAAPEPPLPGDLNGDGVVKSEDLDIVRAGWGTDVIPGDLSSGDANADGVVNSIDLDIVRSNWGANVADVPEPSALLLVLVATVLFEFRRRR